MRSLFKRLLTSVLLFAAVSASAGVWILTPDGTVAPFDGDMNCRPLTDVESQTDCNGCFTHYPDGAIGVPNGVIVYGCDSNTPAVGDMICSNEVWTAEQISSTSSGGFYDNTSTTNRFWRYVCREWDGDSWEVVENQDIDGTVNIHGNLILIDGLGTNIISSGARGNILMGTNNGTIYLGPQSHGNIVQARIGSGSMLTIGTNCNVNKIAAWIDGGSGETLMVVNGSSGNTITHRSADEASRLDNSSYNYVDANDTFLTNCSYNVIVASSTQTNGLFNAVVGSKLGLPGATVDGIDTTLSSSSTKLPTSAAVYDSSYPRQLLYATIDPSVYIMPTTAEAGDAAPIVPLLATYDVNSCWELSATATGYVVNAEQDGHWLRVKYNIMLAGNGEPFAANNSWVFSSYASEIHHQWYNTAGIADEEWAVDGEVTYLAATGDRVLLRISLESEAVTPNIVVTSGDGSDGTYLIIEDLGPNYRR